MTMPLYVGKCCREWLMGLGRSGTCKRCGGRPRHVGPTCCPRSYQCPTTKRVECLIHGGAMRCCRDPQCPGARQ